MRVICSHCQGIVEVDDAAVKRYIGRINGQIKSEAKTAALTENAKKKRPGSLGNQRAKKKTE